MQLLDEFLFRCGGENSGKGEYRICGDFFLVKKSVVESLSQSRIDAFGPLVILSELINEFVPRQLKRAAIQSVSGFIKGSVWMQHDLRQWVFAAWTRFGGREWLAGGGIVAAE